VSKYACCFKNLCFGFHDNLQLCYDWNANLSSELTNYHSVKLSPRHVFLFQKYRRSYADSPPLHEYRSVSSTLLINKISSSKLELAYAELYGDLGKSAAFFSTHYYLTNYIILTLLTGLILEVFHLTSKDLEEAREANQILYELKHPTTVKKTSETEKTKDTESKKPEKPDKPHVILKIPFESAVFPSSKPPPSPKNDQTLSAKKSSSPRNDNSPKSARS
jgi:hypothetical protein